VVVIDALDEAEHMSGVPQANRLLLPASLPERVFFIVTTRESEEYRLFVDRSRDIHLADSDPRNMDDVRVYVQWFVETHRPAMLRQLEAWHVDEDVFVETMTRKSEGNCNFMYITYMMRDLRDGMLPFANLDRIDDLPQGLRAYYQRHWRAMQAQDSACFRDYYQPVVCVLASAFEPVSISQIVAWTERRWPHLDAVRIRDVLRDWREFLNEDTRQRPALYSLYHTSFRDFLREEVGLAEYHQEIALRALAEISPLPDSTSSATTDDRR
jgi:hypothetical protein